MSIRLCQDCYQWVQAPTGRCPDCDSPVPEVFDPVAVAERVRAASGETVGPLGDVRIHRKGLPADGMLFETRFGVLFLPHRTVTVERLIEENSSSWLWKIAASVWAPFLFLSWFFKRKRTRLKLVDELEPVQVTADRMHLLPDLLTRLPGAAFIPVRQMARFQRVRSRWRIERINGSVFLFEPLSPAAFAQRCLQLQSHEQWRVAMGAP